MADATPAGAPDDRVLPGSASSREVGDLLRSGFAANPTTNAWPAPNATTKATTISRTKPMPRTQPVPVPTVTPRKPR